MRIHGQRGAYAVEFALAVSVLVMVLLAIADFGRVLFRLNSVAEATRVGARVSVVCNPGAGRVLTEMQKFVPLNSSNVTISWYDTSGAVSTSCDSTSCAGVSVSVSGLSVAPVSPVAWIGFSSLTVPAFSTYLPRESMGQDPNSSSVCS